MVLFAEVLLVEFFFVEGSLKLFDLQIGFFENLPEFFYSLVVCYNSLLEVLAFLISQQDCILRQI